MALILADLQSDRSRQSWRTWFRKPWPTLLRRRLWYVLPIMLLASSYSSTYLGFALASRSRDRRWHQAFALCGIEIGSMANVSIRSIGFPHRMSFARLPCPDQIHSPWSLLSDFTALGHPAIPGRGRGLHLLELSGVALGRPLQSRATSTSWRTTARLSIHRNDLP